MTNEELQKCKQLLCSEDEANIKLACLMLSERDLALIMQEERSMLHKKVKENLYQCLHNKEELGFKHRSIFNTSLSIRPSIYKYCDKKYRIQIRRMWCIEEDEDSKPYHFTSFTEDQFGEKDAWVYSEEYFPFTYKLEKVSNFESLSKLHWYYCSFTYLKEMNRMKEYYIKKYKNI